MVSDFLGYLIFYLALTLIFSCFIYGFKYFIFMWLKKRGF